MGICGAVGSVVAVSGGDEQFRGFAPRAATAREGSTRWRLGELTSAALDRRCARQLGASSVMNSRCNERLYSVAGVIVLSAMGSFCFSTMGTIRRNSSVRILRTLCNKYLKVPVQTPSLTVSGVLSR